MATQVVVTFGSAMPPAQSGHAPVLNAKGVQTEEESVSTSAVATTMTVTAPNAVAVISNNGTTAIWAAFGANPTAAVGTDHFVMAGETRDFGGLSVGDKVSLIEDT